MTDYTDRWQRYKLLRSLWVALFVLEFFDIEFAGSLMRAMPAFTPESVVIGVQFAFGVALLLISEQLWKWTCPRCGKSFFGGRKVMDKISTCLNWLFLPKECVSCGLPKYSIDPVAAPGVPEAKM